GAQPARSATPCRRRSRCCAGRISGLRCSSTTVAIDAMTQAAAFDAATIEAGVRRWLERAVIGLNLCPFAKAVYVKQQVRIVVSDASTERALLEQLGEELALLRDTPAEAIDTTLLVHPQVLADFLDYNDFLGDADALVEAMALD